MATLRSINVSEVERRRDDIVARALRVQIGQPVIIERLVDSVIGMLPAGVPYDAVFESVRYLAGRTFEEVEAIRLAWRIAGNLRLLKVGNAILPWSLQREDEWAPFQIIQIARTRNSKDKLGFDVTSRVMAGTAAPLKVISFWSMNVTKYVAFKLGFSKPWHNYPFKNAADLVGLRFYGLIEAARSRGRPEFHEVDCPQSMQKWNRDNVLKLRLRVGMKCPAEFTHKCHLCAFGYDQCSAGTHPKTYTLGFCSGCGQADTPFDPADPSPHCVACASTARLRKKTN